MSAPSSSPAPSRVIGKNLQLINLRHCGMAKEDSFALCFEWEEGNRIAADYAVLREGVVYLWNTHEWLMLDARALDLSAFQEKVTLLPLPEGVTVEMLPAIGTYRPPFTTYQFLVKPPQQALMH